MSVFPFSSEKYGYIDTGNRKKSREKIILILFSLSLSSFFSNLDWPQIFFFSLLLTKLSMSLTDFKLNYKLIPTQLEIIARISELFLLCCWCLLLPSYFSPLHQFTDHFKDRSIWWWWSLLSGIRVKVSMTGQLNAD